MKKKYFKINNSNKFNTIVSNLLQYFINIAWAVIIANLSMLIARTIGNAFENNIVNYIIEFVMAIIALFLWALIFIPFIPKKVVIDDYSITIKRNWFNLDILPNIWKWKIYYNEIVSCEMFNEYYSKSRWVLSGNRYVYYFPSWNNVVVISTNTGKNYYIPLENPDNFIAQVKAEITKNNIDDSSMNTEDDSMC